MDPEPPTNQTGIDIILEDVARVRRSRFLVPSENEGHPVEDTSLHVDGAQAPKSLTGGTAVSGCREDAGDSDQLRDTAGKRTFNETADSIAYTGTNFLSTSGSERPEALPDDFQDDLLCPLETVIRGCMINAARQEGLQFLPLSELETIITIPHIAGELRRSEVSSNVDQIASQVLEEVHTSDGNLTTRRKLFAILCLMENAAAIVEFINEGIFDADLPFEFDLYEVHRRSNTKTLDTKIKLFFNWSPSKRDSFKNYQGQFLSPYFKLGADSNASFGKYTLHHCVVLPFEEIEAENSAYNPHLLGGTSEVRKVKIHTAHYDHADSSIPSEKAYFAVKEIRKSEAAARPPNRETNAYRRLNPIRHPHIVRLLAEYVHNGHLNLIFPWADGNLFQFWKKHYPKTDDLNRGHLLCKWLINQFHGLSTALVQIHDLTSSSLILKDQAQNHGRHGDFKPENVLWFRDSSESGPISSLGTLMISDLGSAEFHGTHSQDVRASAVSGHTETYKAPEFDKMASVSPKADIWSFACVLMEFLVWYILGRDGVDAFAQARKYDSNLWYAGDHFFNYNDRDNTVEMKVSVTNEFRRLRQLAPSDFMLDLLDFIEKRMLLLRPADRASCKNIADRFSALQERCVREVRYCTERTQKNLSRTPTGASDKVSVPLSPEQQEENAKNISDHRLHISPSSEAPSAAETARDDGRSRTPGDENASDNQLSPSRKGGQDTSTEHVQTEHDQESTRVPKPERSRGRHHLSRRKRAWNEVVKSIKGCFGFNDDT